MIPYKKERFEGITVALYSCFDAANKVDAPATRKLTDFYRGKGVKGLYVCGSTGEGVLMTVEERKATLEAVMEACGPEMNIIVHIGAAATHDAVELARHAEQVGAHAVSAIPSIYYRLSEAAIEGHWGAMCKASKLPFIIYNIPQLTGYDLSRKLLETMMTYPTVIGIKNSAESTYATWNYKHLGGPDFLVLNGPDEQYLAGRIMGADGGIGGTYGVMPELFLAMEAAWKRGDLARAQFLQGEINEIIAGLLSFPSLYGAAKAIMGLRGVNIGGPRAPFLPVGEHNMPRLLELHQKLEGFLGALKANGGK